MTAVRPERWLPEPAVRVRHSRRADVDPDALWTAAQGVRLRDTPTLGRLVRWRIPGLAAELSYRELLGAAPFTLLGEGERCSVSGLAGRIWTPARVYGDLPDAAAFASWDQRGTVRVLFAHWVQAAPDGRSELVSEARVQPVDRTAALRLRALWAVVGVFERLVGAEPLTVAVRRAERGQPAG